MLRLLLQLLGAAVCLVPTALAQCANSTTTIRNAADAASLTSCATFTGVIAVATDSAAVIELDGIQELDGSLIVANNSNITTIAAGNLVTITNDLIFSNLTLLYNITFPSFYSIDTVVLNNIPAPNVVDLSTGEQVVNNVYITETYLEGLVGLSLIGSAQLKTLQVTDNYYLTEAQFAVGNITQSATVANNGGNFWLSMPNLTYAYNMVVSNVSLIDMPLLQSVNSGLDLTLNPMQNLTLPSLSYVGGGFNITDNAQMQSFNMSQLTYVNGDVNVVNNSALNTLNGFSALSNVGGTLDLVGSFTNATLPALRNVRGDMTMQSTSTFNCSDIPSTVVQGTYSCNGEGGNSTTSTASSSGHGGGLSTGAVVGIAVGVSVPVTCIIAIGFFFFFRHRRRTQAPVQTQQGVDHQHPLQYQKPPPGEVGGKSRFDAELSAEDGKVEELELNTPMSEVGRSTSQKYTGIEGRHELPMQEAQRYELPGSDHKDGKGLLRE